ncbi:hypothetical protein F4780DRAFT_510090 [Xylariomycetidae sp. FL0641]|nr:hypothetical protein F4780DRAFT_510090 [Xylariomycetidae sp. FL0641]
MMLNVITTSVFAAVVSGAAVSKRDGCAYSVTNFYASCIPHSVECSYEFDVISAIGSAPTGCSSMLMGPDYLPAVGLTGYQNAAYSWSAQVQKGWLALEITTSLNDRVNLTGTHEIPNSQLAIQDNGASRSQRYTGLQNFAVAATGTEA